MFRQGDVLLVRESGPIPSEAVRIEPEYGLLILARGELTGHAHAVGATHATLWSAGALTFLELREASSLDHQEHASVELPAGTYRVVHQREYAPTELDFDGARFVRD